LADSLNPQGVTIAGNTGTFGTGDVIDLSHSSLPPGTPMPIFQTERYKAADPNMSYSFAVESGETYEVRLYLAEIFIDENYVGIPRVFDVSVEGSVPSAFEDIALFETYGHDVGVMLSAQVTMSDGTLTVEFLPVSENPKISAIEIVKLP
jgi:hypothetical protein